MSFSSFLGSVTVAPRTFVIQDDHGMGMGPQVLTQETLRATAARITLWMRETIRSNGSNRQIGRPCQQAQNRLFLIPVHP